MARILLENVAVRYPVFERRAQELRHLAFGALARPLRRALSGPPAEAKSVSTASADIGSMPAVAQSAGSRLDLGRGYVQVRALEDVSLDLSDGVRLGLLGHNGSGKSTLLRLMAGSFAPTSGRAVIEGRPLTLFNLQDGCVPDATGRENIVLKALSLGIPRRAIVPKLDEIIAFTELGHHIDLPMRTYSKGMQLRLCFGTVTAFRPQILLVDEILGVGDAAFAEKARLRLAGMLRETNICVIASHNRRLLATLCTEVITMNSGCIEKREPAAAILPPELSTPGPAMSMPAASEPASDRLSLGAPGAGGG